MEEPAVLAEVGDPVGLRILDLGCGDASFGRRMLLAGARSYRGVDASRRMIDAARANLRGTSGEVQQGDIASVRPASNSTDLVVARLSMHYLADIDEVLKRTTEALTPGGRFICTVVHPVVTSFDTRPAGARTSWTVDEYFDRGPRTRSWLGSEVVWQHRTVEDYVRSVIGAGLTLTALRECEPVAERFGGHLREFARRRRIPLFLLLSARR